MTEFEAASLAIAEASFWVALASTVISGGILATMAIGLRSMIQASKDRGAQMTAVLSGLNTTMKALDKTLSELDDMRNNVGPAPS